MTNMTNPTDLWVGDAELGLTSAPVSGDQLVCE